MSVSFRIALRYLFARKSHAAVNVISMVTIGGIALAVAAMVVVMSVFNGFHSLIESRLSVLDPPLSARPAQGKDFAAADSLCALLEADAAIGMALPVIEERALASAGNYETVVRLKGIPRELYSRFDTICKLGMPWAGYHPAAEPGVVSVGVANRLQLRIGEEQLMKLYVPRRKGRINPAVPMSAFRADSLAPSALYAVNQEEDDADVVYAPYALVSRLLQYDNQATDIYIYPPAGGDIKPAKAAAAAILGSGARVTTLQERRTETFRVVNMEKWITFMLLGFILLIASFNVVSSLSLLIIEKEPNAAILRAIGATNGAIRAIYRIEGLLICGIGTVAGAILGSLLSLGQQHFGWVKLSVSDPSQLSVTAYPVEFHPFDLIPVIAISAAVALLTSFLAIRKA